MDNRKICFESNRTKETGKRIIDELIKLGGRNSGLEGINPKGYYYFIDANGFINNTMNPSRYNLEIKQLPYEFKIGDALKVNKGALVRSVEGRSLHLYSGYADRDIEYIFKMDDDFLYIDKKDYKGSDYLKVNRKDVTLYQETKEIMKRIITPKQAQSIINIACAEWKLKLADYWSKKIVLTEGIPVSKELYQQMRKVCTTPQNKLFDEIFGKDDGTIKAEDLKIGEAILESDENNLSIILKTPLGYVDIFNPENSTVMMSKHVKGKKVKLNITYEQI